MKLGVELSSFRKGDRSVREIAASVRNRRRSGRRFKGSRDGSPGYGHDHLYAAFGPFLDFGSRIGYAHTGEEEDADLSRTTCVAATVP